MPTGNYIGNAIGSNLVIPYWKPLWESLVSATVEQGYNTKVVMTFSKADTRVIASDFTILGFSILSLSREALFLEMFSHWYLARLRGLVI
jgi:hypothetical protein